MNQLPPGLAGFVAAQDQQAQRQQQAMQQAVQMQGLLAHVQDRQADQALRAALADAGGDPEKAMQVALRSGNVAAASKLAPLVKQQQEERARTADAESLSGADLQDPATLRSLAVKLKKPEFVTHAERIEKGRGDAQAMELARAKPAVEPGLGMQGNAAQAGLFAALAGHENPAIASQARNLQNQVNTAPAHMLPFFERQQAELGRQAAAFDNRPAKPVAPEPLVPVKEADGRVIYVPRSQAVNREVGVRTTDPNLGKAVQQLGRDIEKAGLNTMIPVIENASKITLDQAKWLTGPFAVMPDVGLEQAGAPKGTIGARQDLAKFFNITLKDRSGAAVTNQELERAKEEFGKGLLRTPQSLLDAIKNVRSIVAKHYQGIAATHGKDALDAYHKQLEAVGGTPFNYRDSPAAAPGAPKPAAASPVDALLEKYK